LFPYLTYQTLCLTFVLQQQTDASARASDVQPTSADAPTASSRQNSSQAKGSNRHQGPTKAAKSCTVFTTPTGASEPTKTGQYTLVDD